MANKGHSTIIGRLTGLLSALSDTIYPRLCPVCGTPLVGGERLMCLQCRCDMPLCDGVHLDPFNLIHKRLMRHVPIERAGAYFYYYRESRYTQLILTAKYRRRPGIVRQLAREYAEKIKADGFFDGIDLILPVPMHPFKELQRGFNQTDYIARGLRDITGIAIGHNLTATRRHATQTRKNTYNRWLNARSAYGADNPEELAGKHLLVVDDVITTGATLAACCEALHQAVPDATISVLALAVTELQ